VLFRFLASTPTDPTADIAGLNPEDRRDLRAWIEDARGDGIDGVADLRGRAWPVPIEAHVLGVFRRNDDGANWLVVGQNAYWTVVAVDKGTVLATRRTLGEALTSIHRRRSEGLSPRA
jgi:hypothetical protein